MADDGATIQGVLFDKDGVLVDFDATWCPATVKVIDLLAAGDAGRRDALAEAEGVRVHHSSIANLLSPSASRTKKVVGRV